MQWIIRFIVSNRNITSLVAVVCICLALLTRSSDQQHRISRMLTLSIFYPFQFYVSQTTRIKNIFMENRTLKEKIAAQSLAISLLTEKIQGIDRLEELLQLKNELAYDLVTARVVAREPSFISRSIVISAGKENGVAAYMPVVNSSGIIGKVIQTTRHLALVQLLIDPSNRTGVMIQRSRVAGILETENGSDFFVKCRTHADVNQGDTVVTSGLGGVYPKGLSVGIVSHIQENIDPLFKKLFVHVNADFNRLEEVFVLLVQSQWASFRNELDSLGQQR